MRLFLVLIAAGLLIASCGSNNSENNSDIAIEDSSSKEPLYPYPQYIQSQLEYIDSMPLAIERIVYENHELVDSGYIDHRDLKQLAEEFYRPDLNLDELRPHYIEKSYQDLTINTITFSITAKDPELEVQQVDVLLNPTTKKVKNIIMKKREKTSNGFELKNLLWVNNMNFQISSTIQKNDGSSVDRVVKVIWDRPLK